MAKIALVTEELSVFGLSGGIGAAFCELALVLAGEGNEVDVIYVPPAVPSASDERRLRETFAEDGISLQIVDPSRWVWAAEGAKERAYAVYRYLVEKSTEWDFIHFHEYKGLGFFCAAAKEQGEAFAETILIVQLHGPLRWTLHTNAALFHHPDQLLVDYLERESIRLADHVISPSRYLIDWMKQNDFILPADDRVHVIKNNFRINNNNFRSALITEEKINVRDIIFFGRHERRKGILSFCDALDLAADAIEQAGVSVCFLGGLGELNGMPSGVILNQRSRKWRFPVEFRVGLDRRGALAFLRTRPDALVVMPSSAENSPYTVLEAIAVGRAVLTSKEGGAGELIDEKFHNEALVDTDPVALAVRIKELIESGVRIPCLAELPSQIADQWIAFHRDLPRAVAMAVDEVSHPKVVVGITHFERPEKVIAAITSAIRQTYNNLEIVVVDDGSRSEATRTSLPQIRAMLDKVGGRLIERENGYLGAARNTIARSTDSDYLVFLDDDDLLFPDAVQRMVRAAQRTGAEVINCLNYFLDVQERSKYELRPESWQGKVSYIPLGGPLSVSHLANHFGAATALIRRDFFDSIDGYTEIQRVGYEDYELFLRVVQAGGRIAILPEPLYLYEVGKPSMVSTTSRVENKRRVFAAVDCACNVPAWRDALELAAGIEAIADEANHIRWVRSNSPHRELLERMVSQKRVLSDRVKDLVEHARAIGAAGAAMAWTDALLPADEAVDVRKVRAARRSSNVTPITHPSGLPLEIADLLVSLSLGRIDTAARELATNVARQNEISGYHLECLRQIIESSELKADTAALLLKTLADAWVNRDIETDLRSLLGLLAIISGKPHEARDHFAEVIIAEAPQYIRANPDVGEAFGDGAIESALQHFHEFGQAEGRIGFDVLKRAAATFSKREDRRVTTSELVKADIHLA